MANNSIQITDTPPLPGTQLVSELNDAFEAVATDFSGPVDPAANAFAYSLWADTSTGNLKRRDGTNSIWNIVGRIFPTVREDASGNLLVGTTSSPAYNSKLRVNGGIETHFTQFNMVGNSGATFEWVLRTGSTQSFYVNNASVVATLSTTGVWTNASDARYKENIVESSYGLSTVMELKPRAYNLIGQADKPQIGFIAQEVLDVLPEVVDSTYNSITEEDRYTLSYGQLTAVLTKAIQEQQALITQLQADVAALKA